MKAIIWNYIIKACLAAILGDQKKGKYRKTLKRVQRSTMARGSLLASLLIAQLVILNCEGININEVPFTSVADAIPERAVCIDGSPAGYHHDLGFGDGVNNWIIYLMGGGWCNNYLTCQQRRKSPLGSTKNIKPTNFGGILSPNRGINPDFFNWNRVHVHYCDGSSFIGDTAIIHQGPHLQLRGSRIFRAITNELLEKGMKNAKNALLVGGSAGGLSAILNCDNFRANLGNVSRVKCVSDAGFFIRAKNVPYAGQRERRFNSVVRFHNLASFLPKLCTSRMRSGLCLFPENLVEDIQTPLFLINSVFDRVQITRNLKPRELRDIKGWKNCTKDLSKCTHPQRKLIKDFGKALHETLVNIGDDPSRGLFIHACYAHTYMESNEFWNSSGSPKLGNKRPANSLQNSIEAAIDGAVFGRAAEEMRCRAREMGEKMREEEGAGEIDEAAELLWRICCNNKLTS